MWVFQDCKSVISKACDRFSTQFLSKSPTTATLETFSPIVEPTWQPTYSLHMAPNQGYLYADLKLATTSKVVSKVEHFPANDEHDFSMPATTVPNGLKGLHGLLHSEDHQRLPLLPPQIGTPRPQDSLSAIANGIPVADHTVLSECKAIKSTSLTD
jgi:hypothetical protein